jgi:hypothetical protein
VLEISSQVSERSCICVGGNKCMTSHLPGLIPLTQMHDLSLTWLGTSNTYMTSNLPGLIPLTQIHDL